MYRMTSVSPRLVDARVERSRTLTQPSPLPTHTGLISQVAEEIWEVKDRKIKNLTKEDLTIVDYKKKLVQASYTALEKAKLFSKGNFRKK